MTKLPMDRITALRIFLKVSGCYLRKVVQTSSAERLHRRLPPTLAPLHCSVNKPAQVPPVHPPLKPSLMRRRGTALPFPEKSAGDQASFENPTSATVGNAGILIDRVLGESVIGIVWSGQMILEDGGEEDARIPIVVKMAIPQDSIDGEVTEDTRKIVRHEASVYEFLAKSGQPEISPRYYGVFEDKAGTVALILDNVGMTLKSFEKLTGEQ
ncbi:hypothetical protein FB451DRAFT_502789 [Mycena latifolia]|nr:hypothetical protein FB451DRAFT_502789 [Mycena latifolia]